MNEPTQFLNGQWVDRATLKLDVDDLGVLQGVAVSERLRTFQGRLFRLADHLERLHHSLDIIGLDARSICGQMESLLPEVVRRHLPWIDSEDDLSITLFVTPGIMELPLDKDANSVAMPTIGIHARPIPFADWAEKYTNGERLVVSDIRQIPPACWPPELKCRSRMHYYLADRQARRTVPGARALVLNMQGCVCEASTANVLLVDGNGLVSPRMDTILPGVSLTVVRELAGQLGVPFTFRDIRPAELLAATEVFLASTSPCLLPVTACDGQPIGDGVPGPLFHRLLDAWSVQVGLPIIDQAQRFALRTPAK